MEDFWKRVVFAGLVIVIFLIIVPYAILVKVGIIPLLIYFQLVILVAQLELMARSQELYALQYYPQVYITTKATGDSISVYGKSKNVPAYNPGIARVLGDAGPIDPSKWGSFVINLYPPCVTDENTIIAVIRKSIFEELGNKLTFEVIYQTGQDRNNFSAIFLMIRYDPINKTHSAYVIPPKYRRRSFPAVLYVLENIAETYELIKTLRWIRKFERNKISQDHSKQIG